MFLVSFQKDGYIMEILEAMESSECLEQREMQTEK